MTFAVKCTHPSPPRVAWGLERPTNLWGNVVPYTTTSHERDMSTWAERADAERCAEWLNADNRRPTKSGWTAEAVET